MNEPLPAVRRLESLFRSLDLFRPFRRRRYEPGDILELEATGVFPALPVRLKLEIERFVGGGYAGQVYKVRAAKVEAPDGQVPELAPGGSYALKILVPPTGFGRFFRGLLYGIGFQGPFSLQVNPDALKAGALWQKFIRRGAALRLGTERAVVNVLAVFIDPGLGSCGELSEWVEGRTWRYEVDDGLFARLRWKPGRPDDGLGSPEYRAKREFMEGLVRLMHEMGACELARQYEWWTLKSQPNALKRCDSEGDPRRGHTAVDFRAGLVLLPFLPQCPADFRLIIQGFGRGSLVQFDRGNLGRLETFVAENEQAFSDLPGALEDLKRVERGYRDSLPDITHNHVRLVTRPRLWKMIAQARVRSWEIRNMVDAGHGALFRRSSPAAALFLLLGFLPALVPLLFILRFPGRNPGLWALWLAPLLGPFLRKLWGRRDFRAHAAGILTSPGYLGRAFKGRVAETLIGWQRSGRVSESRALSIARKSWTWLCNLPLAWLPPGLHRFLTDKAYFRERLEEIFVRPVRLYFNADLREKWLLEMIEKGERNGLLCEADAVLIRSQLKEPFIQKYLKSLAVHLCTLFVSETVFLTVAAVYILSHPDLGWQQATLQAGLLLGAFNLLPVSPGSLVRGVYVLILMAKERNIRDYRIALPLSFLKVVGYLAFPVQMAYRFPELARFMAAHWATNAVRVVPVFGERGAWLEHAVFDAFYNYPLSLRKRIGERDAALAAGRPRRWGLPAAVLGAGAVLVLIEWAYAKLAGIAPAPGRIWWAGLIVPPLTGFAASCWSSASSLSKRVFRGVLAGFLAGVLYAATSTFFALSLGEAGVTNLTTWEVIGMTSVRAMGQGSLFLVLAFLGALVAENRAVKPARPGTR